jgi:hypothetical protein
MLPKTGKRFPYRGGRDGSESTYARAIAGALRSELGETHQAVKCVSDDHLLSGEPSNAALIQPVPASVSTCTQFPERSSSLTVASFGAVPITRPFLPGADRMLAGPRITTRMFSFFGAAAA